MSHVFGTDDSREEAFEKPCHMPIASRKRSPLGGLDSSKPGTFVISTPIDRSKRARPQTAALKASRLER